MQIGDKVVCIDSKPVYPASVGKWTVIGEIPTEGRVYVISQVNNYESRPGGFPRCTGLELVGITAYNTNHPDIRGFNALRFRLLSELKEEAKARNLRLNESEAIWIASFKMFLNTFDNEGL